MKIHFFCKIKLKIRFFPHYFCLFVIATPMLHPTGSNCPINGLFSAIFRPQGLNLRLVGRIWRKICSFSGAGQF